MTDQDAATKELMQGSSETEAQSQLKRHATRRTPVRYHAAAQQTLRTVTAHVRRSEGGTSHPNFKLNQSLKTKANTEKSFSRVPASVAQLTGKPRATFAQNQHVGCRWQGGTKATRRGPVLSISCRISCASWLNRASSSCLLAKDISWGCNMQQRQTRRLQRVASCNIS